jgi:hypothetical protein
MKRFFTPAEAAEWLSRRSDFPLSERDVLAANEQGNLYICFKYRGKIGEFSPFPKIDIKSGFLPTQHLFPEPILWVYFDGYLRSLNGCRLGIIQEHFQSKRTPDGLKSREFITRDDILIPNKVEPVEINHSNQKLPTLRQEGGFWGRVYATSGYMNRTSRIPKVDWFFYINDLKRYATTFCAHNELDNHDTEKNDKDRREHQIPVQEQKNMSDLSSAVASFSKSGQTQRSTYDHDPSLQKQANEFAKNYYERTGKYPTKAEVAKELHKSPGNGYLDPDTINRRIRVEWKGKNKLPTYFA